MTQIPPPPGPTRKGLLGEFSGDVVTVEMPPHVTHLSQPGLAPTVAHVKPAPQQELTAPPVPAPFSLSFEFFPPHTDEGLEKLKKTSRLLAAFYPEYYSVTFGAAGSVQSFTINTVLALKQASAIPVTPHISCIGATTESISEILQTYKQAGIRHLVVLRGDKPSGMLRMGAFRYAADLVKFIRQQQGDHFFIEVAAYPEYHPECCNPEDDFKNFKAKVAAGANRAITQYFYNIDSYWYFIDRCQRENMTIPIVPGIMPITNYKQLQRFSDTCGAEIPRWLRLRLAQYENDPISLQKLGTDFVAHMCQQLMEQGIPGLHFYTLNKAEPSIAICQQLQWKQTKINLAT